ncbi:MAG TPA: ribosome-binding factor A [Candidatus Paceibacterota bacterium]|jgi:ribosome-binding factor A|nr:ribosome-binding factor A [Candidatus Paceibacterota bacterium]
MDHIKREKREEQVREVAARFIERESIRPQGSGALITVTRVQLDEKCRTGTIFFSVLPESEESSALHFLKRQRPALREVMKKELSFFPIPFLDITIDEGEKSRQTIDALLKE